MIPQNYTIGTNLTFMIGQKIIKVQVVNEVESAIKDSKGNVLGFNVDGNIHLNFLRQFICYCLRYY